MPRLSAVTATAGFLTVIAALAVGAGERFCRHELPAHLTRPGLAMQLASSVSDVEKVLGLATACPGPPRPTPAPSCAANRATLVQQQYRDFVFIPIYVVFFVLLGAMLCARGGWRVAPGVAVVVLAVVAGYFDVKEDRVILAILDRVPACAVMPRAAALVKWRAICGLLFLAAPLFVPPAGVRGLGRWFGYAAALLGASATYFAWKQHSTLDDGHLETAATLVAAAVLSAWVAVAARAWFPDGLLPALDAWASRGWLRRVANWPRDE